jgi:hypothetical protein
MSSNSCRHKNMRRKKDTQTVGGRHFVRPPAAPVALHLALPGPTPNDDASLGTPVRVLAARRGPFGVRFGLSASPAHLEKCPPDIFPVFRSHCSSRLRCDRCSLTLTAVRYEAIGCSMRSTSFRVMSQTCEGVTARLRRPVRPNGLTCLALRKSPGLSPCLDSPLALPRTLETRSARGQRGGDSPPDCLLWTARGAPPTRSGGWGTAGQPMAGRDKADSLRPSEEQCFARRAKERRKGRQPRSAKSMTAPWAAGAERERSIPTACGLLKINSLLKWCCS